MMPLRCLQRLALRMKAPHFPPTILQKGACRSALRSLSSPATQGYRAARGLESGNSTFARFAFLENVRPPSRIMARMAAHPGVTRSGCLELGGANVQDHIGAL